MMKIRGFFAGKVFCYKATVRMVHNRSTVFFDVDLGFNIFRENQRYRLLKVNDYVYKSNAISTVDKVKHILREGDSVLLRSERVRGINYCEVTTNIQLAELYHYKSKVVNIVDGDTIDVDLDLGFSTHYIERFRLYGIDAWEKSGDERIKGLLAKTRVVELIPPGTEIITKTIKDAKGKYGRYLGDIYMLDNPMSINQILLEEGHATPYI